jgi:mono/diheme cytochrome c family protein
MKAILVACSLLLWGMIAAEQPGRGDRARGEYLVRHVAMCVQCHTPRDENGDLIASKLLDGAAVPVSRPWQGKAWAEFAPRIAGIPQYTDEQAMTLLTTGIGRTGKELRAPMPPFRLAQQDARDIIAYLRSLQ